MLSKNQLYDVRVTDVNNLGYGVCRIDGIVTFVAGGVTDDLLCVRIIKVARDYAVARIETVLSPSRHRRTPACGAFPRCGGCTLLHLTDEYEAALKEGFVRAALDKAGLSQIEVRPLLRGKARTHYRNKAQYPLFLDQTGKLCAGFFARKSHTPVEASDCLLQPPHFSEIVRAFCELAQREGLTCYDEEHHRGLLRHLILREGKNGTLVEIVVNAAHFAKGEVLAARLAEAFPCIVGVLANYNECDTNVIRGAKNELLYGEGVLTQTLCGQTLAHGAASFFQVNCEAAELLFSEARRLLGDSAGKSVCDLYCGVGAVGQCVCPEAELHGADVVSEAISFAEQNAKENGCDATYVCMDAGEYFEAAGRFDTVLLDPPRGGASPELIRLLLSKKPRRILYISCNPDTLARDLRALCDGGYHTDGLTPVDLFPKTGHVESVVLLNRKDACARRTGDEGGKDE